MPRYNADHYDPPAPLAGVTLRPSDGRDGRVHDVPLLIDTGADVTLLPRWAITRLGLTPLPAVRYDLYGFDGTHIQAEAIELDLSLLDQTFRGRYLLTDATHGLLGRDVLNALRLTFDGRRQEWSA